MPSPFPGMDPNLESPDVWPDSQQALAVEISRDLNRTLPRPYYARLVMRPEIGIVEDEPLRHHSVEIRDGSRGHALVTLIEILSPSNKRPGPDRRSYEAKQKDVLESDTSLVEIDLLRGGERLIGGPLIVESVGRLAPQPDYVVGVSRAWERGAELDYELFPIRLEDPLPCVPVPLREGEAEVPLDLQYAFNLVYEGGPYARGAVDYGAPPDPPLRPELAGWAADCLDRWRSGAGA